MSLVKVFEKRVCINEIIVVEIQSFRLQKNSETNINFQFYAVWYSVFIIPYLSQEKS